MHLLRNALASCRAGRSQLPSGVPRRFRGGVLVQRQRLLQLSSDLVLYCLSPINHTGLRGDFCLEQSGRGVTEGGFGLGGLWLGTEFVCVPGLV